MDNTTVNVDGMNCDHCVNAVTEAVSGLEGVSGVQVDLDGGQVHVAGTPDLASVRSAIVDAGYTPTES